MESTRVRPHLPRQVRGLAVHRAARISAAGHGGQILVSQTTHNLLEDEEEEIRGLEFLDLGEHQLEDLDRPVHLYQVEAEGLDPEFPPMRTTAPAPAAAPEPPYYRRRTILVGALAGVSLLRSRSRSSRSAAEGLRGASRQSKQRHRGHRGAIGRPRECHRGARGADGGRGGARLRVGGKRRCEHGLRARSRDAHRSRPDPLRTAPRWDRDRRRLRVGDEQRRGDGRANRAALVPSPSDASGRERAHSGRGGRSPLRWVSNTTDHTVSRVDIRTGKSVDYAAGADPAGIAIAHCRIWVASKTGNQVLELSRAGGVLKEINVGEGPAAVAVDRDAVWVANSLAGTVQKIDPRSSTVVGAVEVGGTPSGLAIASGRVWVANNVEGTLSWIDSDAKEATPVRVGGRRPQSRRRARTSTSDSARWGGCIAAER